MRTRTFFSYIFSCILLNSFIAAAAEKPQTTILAESRISPNPEEAKAHVESVARELQMLFDKEAPDPAVLSRLKPQKLHPAYTKLTKLPNDQAILVMSPRFTKVKEVFKALDGIVSAQTQLESVEEQNLLVLRGPMAEVEAYRDTIQAMDRPTPQILVEARIVEIFFNDGSQRNMSFSYSTGNGNVGVSADAPGQANQPTTGVGGSWDISDGNGGSFGISMRWLKTAQDARILSAPTILISRNETSTITTGSDIPIQEANTTTSTTTITTKFKRVGVTLEVEPVIINSDNVTLKVLPSVKNVSSTQMIYSASGSYSVPVISVRSIETYLRMRDRQVAMMGGLYSSTNTLQQQRVPLFSDIPGIGELFTGKTVSQETTHLVFFLKIYVFDQQENVTDIYYDPDKRAQTLEKVGTLLNNAVSIPIHPTTMENISNEFKKSMPESEKKKREEENLMIHNESVGNPVNAADPAAGK